MEFQALPENASVSVVLATYNERDHIAALITELAEKIEQPLEIIVVDDNSEDGTADAVDAHPFPAKLIRRTRRGLASAFHRGILESTGDIVCWMDSDMSMPVDVLCKLIAALQNHDIAIGSRYAQGGEDDRQLIRTLSSRIINGFARMVLGGGIRDYDSGFVAVRRTVFDTVTIIPFGYGEYFIEMIYDAYRSGLRIVEVGYVFRDRAAGESKSMPNIWAFCVTGLHYVIRILSLRNRFLFRGGK